MYVTETDIDILRFAMFSCASFHRGIILGMEKNIRKRGEEKECLANPYLALTSLSITHFEDDLKC